MEPASYRFGGGSEETTILPVTLVLLFLASVLILFLPRKYAALPFLLASLLIPLGQVVVVGGLHFMVFRILILVGWVRLVTSGVLFNPRRAGFKLTAIDRAVLWWSVVSVITFSLLYLRFDAFINRMGFAYSLLGVYFLARLLIRDPEDVDRVIKLFSLICALVAVFMILEQQTGRNVFSVFGGVPEIAPVREGRIRSQGPFAHPLIAGTLGATLLPLFLGLWWAKKATKFAVLGLVSGTVMAITCASATPLVGIAAALIALFFWPLRKKMRLVRWGLVTVLVGLHLVMKAPVWALIGRVEVIGGSSADHRYELVNRTILHFWDWWLLGARETESWGYLMHDTVNAFVDAAVSGGLLGLVFFITILVRCFRSIGLALKAAEGAPKLERRQWAWGAWLFANVVAFFGCSYFDQSCAAWYSLLAMISAGTSAPVAGLQSGSNEGFGTAQRDRHEILEPSFQGL
jgi:hypothetical protein